MIQPFCIDVFLIINLYDITGRHHAVECFIISILVCFLASMTKRPQTWRKEAFSDPFESFSGHIFSKSFASSPLPTFTLGLDAPQYFSEADKRFMATGE